MMEKEKKLKENGGAPAFTGASINPNETASS
jgi:hypothetical protein